MQRTWTFLLDITQRTKYFCQRCCYYVYSGWFGKGVRMLLKLQIVIWTCQCWTDMHAKLSFVCKHVVVVFRPRPSLV